MDNIINESMIVVDRKQMNDLLEEMRAIRDQKSFLTIQEKAVLLSKGGTLKVPAICKLLNMSTRTLRRRLEKGDIPMVKDGRDFHMDVEKFLDWYKINF